MRILLPVLVILIFTSTAHAVVPGMWPFLQSLMSFLPQIFLIIVVGLSAILKFGTWKRLFAWIALKIRTKIGASVAALVVIAIAVVIYLFVVGSGGSTNLPSTDKKSAAWTAFRRDVRRSGSADGLAGPQDGYEIWSFREKFDRAGFGSSPAVVGNRVYVGADNDSLYCFNAENGDVIWKFDSFYEVFSSPAVVGDRVYVGEGLHYTEDATFHCVDANTGVEVWSFPTTSHVESSPFVVDGKVLFGAGDDGVYCLNAENGSEIWQYPSVHVDSSPAVYDKKVYFGSGYGRSGVYCVNLDDGSEIWAVDTQYPAWGAPAVWDDKVYTGTGTGNFAIGGDDPAGSVICLNARTGEKLWEYEIEGTVLGAVAIDDGKAYFGSRDSSLYCIDVSSGEKIWEFAADSAIVSSPAVVMGDIYFGADDGIIYCLDGEDGIEKWDFDTSESGFVNVDSRIMGSPAISDGKLFVGSMNFFFYCIGQESD